MATATWTEEMIGAGAAGQALQARIYRTGGVAKGRAPLVLHLHGGAFVKGAMETSSVVAALLADAGATVVSVDYPRAPEHRFPHAIRAAFDALKWLHKSRARWGGKQAHIFVAGEEAGGNLAAGLALMARDQQAPPLAGQILLSPMLDPRMATCSMRQAEAGPVGCKWADGWHAYLGTPDKAAHPYAAPLASSRLAGLAPALILTAEDDLLRDESLAYARRLSASGVTVDQHVLPAPTGWPCAFTNPSPADGAWTAAVRERFGTFFAHTLAALRPASLLPTQA